MANIPTHQLDELARKILDMQTANYHAGYAAARAVYARQDEARAVELDRDAATARNAALTSAHAMWGLFYELAGAEQHTPAQVHRIDGFLAVRCSCGMDVWIRSWLTEGEHWQGTAREGRRALVAVLDGTV